MQIISHTTAMLHAEKVVKRSLPVSLGVTSLGYQCKQCGQLFSPVAPPIHPGVPLRLLCSPGRSYGSKTPLQGGCMPAWGRLRTLGTWWSPGKPLRK